MSFLGDDDSLSILVFDHSVTAVDLLIPPYFDTSSLYVAYERAVRLAYLKIGKEIRGMTSLNA